MNTRTLNTDSLKLLDDYLDFKDVMNDIMKIDSLHVEIMSMQKLDPDLSWKEVGENISSILARLGERNIIPKEYSKEIDKIFQDADKKTSLYIENTTSVLDNLNSKKTKIVNNISNRFNALPENKGFLISGVCIRLCKIKPEKIEQLLEVIKNSAPCVISDKNNGYIHVYTDNKATSIDLEQIIMMSSLKYDFKENIAELKVLKRKDVLENLVLKNDSKKILIGSTLTNIINADDLETLKNNKLKPKI